IPENVETIGVYCFKNCSSLETVTFHEGLRTIEGGAFMGTKITSAVIPDSTTAINTHYYTTGTFNTPNYDGAFENCTELVSVTIGKKLAAISREAFQNCTSLATVIIGDGVETIGTYAFAGCASLTDLTIGTGVATMESNAFANCSKLKQLDIPG
ncbi:MAG: leucine-rich repeat domain-containing protein, partial [Clostridia bacterium]|nr:leucine-rich repeat domain-containing protein [Clostridia bacterium]